MSVRNKKVVLIGGAGFIGHTLALELVRRGATVQVIDSLQVNNLLSLTTDYANTNRERYIRVVNQRLDLMRQAGVELHPQDARDYHALSRIISHAKPDFIVHLAAISHAGKSNKDPFSTFDHSLRTLENALDIARDGLERFVFLSSSMVYGNFLSDQVSEDHQLNPIGIYGALKLSGEKIVIAYQQVFDLPFTIVRPSALYGPRCVSRRVGQVFIENALDGKPLQVDGEGNDKLDFTYVEDLVGGICLTLERPESKNEIFNLTYGNSRPIRDLVTIVKRYFPNVDIQSVQRDRLMPERGTLNVDKARRLLGYDPKFNIDVGFPKYVEWYLEQEQPKSGRNAATA
jgi:nucleoside-diphosphate-sugar epimerase